MAKKARKKSAAKRGKKSKPVQKTKARAAAKKSKPAPKKKAKPAAKPETIGGRLSNAYHTVVDTVTGTDQLRNKLEKPGTSETE